MRKNVWRIDGRDANAVKGHVVWAPAKSIWNTAMFVLAITFAPSHFSWGAFALFLALSYVTLLLGHSLGMHRRLIHKTYDCPKSVERFLVWLGVLVGMAGPFGILRIHDVRDWAQREPQCHDFFAHRRGLWLDAFWQLHCTFRFSSPPRFVIEPQFAQDPWYRFMEATWPLHQLMLGTIFYLGGLGCVRARCRGRYQPLGRDLLCSQSWPWSLDGTGRCGASIELAGLGVSYARRVLAQQSPRIS
jgi:stearoyl-CoA desaturase (delta-9 desaturase)